MDNLQTLCVRCNASKKDRHTPSRTVTRDNRDDRDMPVARTETETETENTISTTKKRFTKPSLGELRAYFAEIGLHEQPQKFLDHYDQNGWVVGRNRTPMKDWKAAARIWKSLRQDERSVKPSTNGVRQLTPRDQELMERG